MERLSRNELIRFINCLYCQTRLFWILFSSKLPPHEHSNWVSTLLHYWEPASRHFSPTLKVARALSNTVSGLVRFFFLFPMWLSHVFFFQPNLFPNSWPNEHLLDQTSEFNMKSYHIIISHQSIYGFCSSFDLHCWLLDWIWICFGFGFVTVLPA